MTRLTDQQQAEQSRKAATIRARILEHNKAKREGKGTLSRSKLAAAKRSLEAILRELLADHVARGGKPTEATVRRFRNLVYGGHGKVGRIKRFNNHRRSQLPSTMRSAFEKAGL